MTKRLELIFTNQGGKAVSISIDDPKEPVNALEVSAAMDAIIANNVFTSFDGWLVSKRGARLVQRNVEMVELEV